MSLLSLKPYTVPETPPQILKPHTEGILVRPGSKPASLE